MSKWSGETACCHAFFFLCKKYFPYKVATGYLPIILASLLRFLHCGFLLQHFKLPWKKKKKPVKYLIFGAKVKGLRPYHLLQIRKTQTKQPNPLQLCNKPSRQIPFPMFLCLYFLKKKDFSANTGNTEGVWTSKGGEEKEKGKDQDTRAAAAAREGNHAPH